MINHLRKDIKRLVQENTIDKCAMLSGRYQMSQLLKKYFSDMRESISLKLLITALEDHYQGVSYHET